MSNALFNKSFLVKLLAVVVAATIIFTVAPAKELSDFVLNANAEAPVYDATLGTYTEANGVLTAVPNNGVGFRGWFDKDGKEVSYKATYTLKDGEKASDFTPVFYNFSLNKNGGFEEYAAGTNLKTGLPADEIWEGLCSGEESGGNDWTTATVTDEYAKSGSKALKALSPYNTTYHDFNNLETQTQYTLKFSYYIPPVTDKKEYLEFVSVLGENMSLSNTANSKNGEYLASKAFDAQTGGCSEGEWKDVSLTFYSANNTTVRLAFTYVSESHTSSAEKHIYIDDVSLTKDVLAEPTYFNEDFTTSIKSWKAVDTTKATLSLENSALKVAGTKNTSIIYSAPFAVKKDADYTISFDADFSGVTEEKFSGGENWINMFLTTAAGMDDGSYRYYTGSPTGYTPKWSIKYTAKRFSWGSSTTEKTDVLSGDAATGKGTSFGGFLATKYNTDPTNGKVKVILEFTAHETSEIYFNFRLNGVGTYVLDNFVIEEENVPENHIYETTLTTVGSAIRTEGEQGLRYKTELDKHYLTADMPYGIRFTEYGTLAIRTDYLGDNELTLDGSYNYNGSVKTPKKGVAYSFADGIDKVYEDNLTSVHYTGTLIGISRKYYNTDYTVRAYFKYVDENGNTGVIYKEQNDVAVYPVAKAAYSARKTDGSFKENNNVREYLYNNIITVYTDKVINISNASAAKYTNFQGISSTVYHATTFFPDNHGRGYTDEQAAIEMDRLADSGITNVRTRFSSEWMWTSSGWNWNSTKMNAIYKWGKMLKERGISVTLNAGWQLTDFVAYYNYNHYDYSNAEGERPLVESAGNNDPDHSDIAEVDYLHGYGTSLYGEDAKAAALEQAARSLKLDFTDSEFAHYSVAAVRYAEWTKQALAQLKANGVNVEYVMPFTETGYSTKEVDPTYCYDEWIIMVMALEDAGIGNEYKIIGPSQSDTNTIERSVRFVEYIYEKIAGSEYEDMIDVNSMHTYPSPKSGYSNTIYEPDGIYASSNDTFSFYRNILSNANQTNKDFWCDEYFVHAADADLGQNVGMLGTQFAAGLVAGMNNGINRMLSWQMFDGYWDNTATYSTGEFVGGIHICGTCPRLPGTGCSDSNCKCHAYTEESYTPRDTYYALNLLGKHLNNKNADVLNTSIVDKAVESDSGLFVGAIKNDKNQTVILVVNTLSTVSTVEINLEKSVNSSFSRYVYNPNEIVADENATSIPSDKSFDLNKTTSFSDVIPAQSFAIYVQDDVVYGDDVDMPLDDIL